MASRNNFILLPAPPAGAGGCLRERPRDAGAAVGLRRAGRRGLPPPAASQAPPAPALRVHPRRRSAQPGCSTWPLAGDHRIDSPSPGCTDARTGCCGPPCPVGLGQLPWMAAGPLGVTSIPREPGGGCGWCRGTRCNRSTRGCGWGGAPRHLPPFPPRSSRSGFGSPVPGQTAVGGTSSNWPTGFAPLAKESDTPGVRLSPERCPSVRRAVPPSSVTWMCKLVLLMLLWITWGIAMGCCFLWEWVDLLPQHAVKELGISVLVPMGEGNLLAPARCGELPPLVLGGGVCVCDLAPAAHPCSAFSPLPAEKLKCRAGAGTALPGGAGRAEARAGGSCAVRWGLLSLLGSCWRGGGVIQGEHNKTPISMLLQILLLFIRFDRSPRTCLVDTGPAEGPR